MQAGLELPAWLISPTLSSQSWLSVNVSTTELLSTFTLYLTTAQTASFTHLVIAADLAASVMLTVAVAQDGVTVPPFESVPLTHALSVITSPSDPDTVRVKVQSVDAPGANVNVPQMLASVGVLAELNVKSTVPSLVSSSVSAVSVTLAEAPLFVTWTV